MEQTSQLSTRRLSIYVKLIIWPSIICNCNLSPHQGRVLGARVGEVVKRTKGKWLEAKLIKAFTNPLRFFLQFNQKCGRDGVIDNILQLPDPQGHPHNAQVGWTSWIQHIQGDKRPITMLLAMDLVELQKTCWTETFLKDPTYALLQWTVKL